jgi:hypothetical protein
MFDDGPMAILKTVRGYWQTKDGDMIDRVVVNGSWCCPIDFAYTLSRSLSVSMIHTSEQ